MRVNLMRANSAATLILVWPGLQTVLLVRPSCMVGEVQFIARFQMANKISLHMQLHTSCIYQFSRSNILHVPPKFLLNHSPLRRSWWECWILRYQLKLWSFLSYQLILTDLILSYQLKFWFLELTALKPHQQLKTPSRPSNLHVTSRFYKIDEPIVARRSFGLDFCAFQFLINF